MEGQEAAPAQEVAQQAGHEGRGQAVPGPQEDGAEDVDHVLHRGALASEDREGEQTPRHGHGAEDAGQGQLFDGRFVHRQDHKKGSFTK